MKTTTQAAATAGLSARHAPDSLPSHQGCAAMEMSVAPPSPAPTSDGNQTTVLHAENLYTRDGVPVNVVVALHWHIRDGAATAVAVARARLSVKGVVQASLGDVVGSTMFGALLAERRVVERHICIRLAGALADLGIATRSCRIRVVAVPSVVQDSGAVWVLEELKQMLLGHRVTRVPGA